MRLLSLHQPYASLIAAGVKQYETRHWDTDYRGAIAIHAAKRKIGASGFALLSQVAPRLTNIPYGAIVAIATLADCLIMAAEGGQVYCDFEDGDRFIPDAAERSCGLWAAGRYAWRLSEVRAIDPPLPLLGMQGFPYIRRPEVLAQIQERLK